MKRFAFSLFALLLVLLVDAVAADAQASGPAPSPASKPLRVATRLVTPFVMEEDGRLTGFSMELWKQLAIEIGHPEAAERNAITVYPTVNDLLSAVSSGKADLAIAAVSITSEREERMDFSQPFFESGLQILVRDTGQASGDSGIGGIFSVLFSLSFLQLVGIMVLLMLIPAHIVYFAERKRPDGMVENMPYFPGIFVACWWAMGTLATQADSMPRSPVGRIVAILWMFFSVVFVASFTANITTALTVKQLNGAIKGPDDLPGKKVVTVRGSTSAAYLRTQNVASQEVAKIEDAYPLLQDKTVDAVVYDSPILQYYATHDGKGKVQTIGPIFRRESYGVVFPNASPLRKTVNAALLKMRESGAYDQLHDTWFGQPQQ